MKKCPQFKCMWNETKRNVPNWCSYQQKRNCTFDENCPAFEIDNR